MKKYNLLVVCVLPLLIGAATFVGVRWWYWENPHLVMEDTIDLGLQEPGKMLQVRLTLDNKGLSPLRITNVRTNCACMSVRLISENAPLSKAVIPPGEQLKAIVRVTVPGSAAGEQRWLVEFETNDPRQPHGQVMIRTKADGVVRAFPPVVHLGTLPRGQKLTRTITIRDTGRAAKCRIVRAVSSQPQHVQIRALRKLDHKGKAQDSPLGAAIAEVDVVIQAPGKPSSVEADIAVFEEGREKPLLKVPVHGVVRPTVTISPAVVVLPRITKQGPVYEVTCVCRCLENKSLKLTVQSSPPGLIATVQASPHGDATQQQVQLRWLPKSQAKWTKQQSDMVRLRAQVADQEEIVEIRVIRQPSSSE